MMIVGIGIDICRADRIEKACERSGERFISRILTVSERDYCFGKKEPWESFAARFAVKEAAFKALGRGWDASGGFTSVEVVSDENGKPSIIFHGIAREFADALGVTSSFVSLTHDSGVSAAVVVLEAG